jgi:hypothetical protein
MTLKSLFVLSAFAALEECTGVSVAQLNASDFVGKDVSTIKAILTSKGLTCGQEYSQKTVGEKQVVDGVFVCIVRDTGLICPEGKKVTIFF